MRWPAPEASEPGAYVLVDHRAMEREIVEAVSERLAEADRLTVREDGERLFVLHRGGEHEIPLTATPHDRYVAISSLTEILHCRYAFFIEAASLDSDTRALLVVAHDVVDAAGPPPAHLVSLERGIDYFSGSETSRGVRIPYLGHSRPEFESAPEAVSRSRETGDAYLDLVLGALLSGDMNDDKLRSLARSIKTDPRFAAATSGRSEDEIVAELRGALAETMATPEVQAGADEARRALRELRPAVAGAQPPKKRWWKLWRS